MVPAATDPSALALAHDQPTGLDIDRAGITRVLSVLSVIVPTPFFVSVDEPVSMPGDSQIGHVVDGERRGGCQLDVEA